VQKNAETSLSQLVSKVSQQVDDSLTEMDRISIQLISDADNIRALNGLTIGDHSDTQVLQETLLSTINAIYRDNIYRASIFTANGDFFSSRDYSERDLSEKIKNLPWMPVAREKKGSRLVLPPHEDDWDVNSLHQVYSLVRLIRNPVNEVGYVEIQQSLDKIKEIGHIQSELPVSFLITDSQNRLLYADYNKEKVDSSYYLNLLNKAIVQSPKQETSTYESKKEFMSFQTSSMTGWTVAVIQSKHDLVSAFAITRNITLVLSFSILGLMLFFFHIFSRQLTSPIRKLTETMQDITIENLPEYTVIRHENNEIKALNKTFQSMRFRLNLAIEEEIQSKSLQLKAHFDSLQAQINPHFLNNMLGVLADMGEEADQSEIANVCRKLANLYRYAGNSSESNVNLIEEL
jgi:two-component system sensor histidine kinase YesM